MGLHASPTCVLNFDDSVGWLVGELNSGMSLMFEMMNRERLATGMMGLGLGEIAYQNALAWARERRQGRDLKGIRDPSQAADRGEDEADQDEPEHNDGEYARGESGEHNHRATAVELAVAKLSPVQDQMRRLIDDTAYVESVLRCGAEKANDLATPILREVQDLVGFLRPSKGTKAI